MAVAGRTIVDAQVHLWKANAGLAWVPGLKPQMPEPFTIESSLPLMDEAGVDRVVIVPPSWPGDRNDYALEAAKRYPDRFAVMGRIPLQDPKAAALLPKWKEQPGMLGVRVTFHARRRRWLTDGTADWFWPAAEKAGIPVMFFAPDNTAAVRADRGAASRAHADHRSHGHDAWRSAKEGRIARAIDDAVALAKYPNVSVKVSSAPNYSLEAYPFRDMTEHLKRCSTRSGRGAAIGAPT